MRTHILWATLLVWLCMPSVGSTQQRPVVPSTAQPGVVERELNTPREPSGPPPPEAPIQPLPTQVAPENASALTFKLSSIEIEGAHAIVPHDLIEPYLSLVGKVISVQDVYAAANAMTVRYRNAGYILSSVIVPPQAITDGIVKLQAVEGYVAHVTFNGYQARPAMLRAMAARVTADRPLRNSTLERFLLLLNDLPRVTAQGVLQPSSTPGAADLVVHSTIYHAGGSLSGSNRGSRLEGPGQFQATLDADSVLALYESTGLQYLQATQGSELRLYGFAHTERLTASGLEMTLAGSRSQANPALAGELAALNLATDTDQGSAQLSFPLLRTRSNNISLRAEVTYNDSKSASLGLTQTQDKIFAARFGVNADHLDSFGGVNSIDLGFGHGFHVLGASPIGDPLASRLGGDPDFSKATLYVARLQGLGSGFSLLLALNGQYGFDHMLVPEEFAYGGEYFGRAYDPSELVGDSGAAAKVELRYTLEQFGLFGATVYGFAEDGKVWQRRTSDDLTQPLTDSAVSVGGGLRFNVTDWVSGYLEAAKPTNHVVAAVGNENIRVFGGLQVSIP